MVKFLFTKERAGQKNFLGENLLMQAASRGRYKVLKWLAFQKSFNLAATDKEGKTVFDFIQRRDDLSKRKKKKLKKQLRSLAKAPA